MVSLPPGVRRLYARTTTRNQSKPPHSEHCWAVHADTCVRRLAISTRVRHCWRADSTRFSTVLPSVAFHRSDRHHRTGSPSAAGAGSRIRCAAMRRSLVLESSQSRRIWFRGQAGATCLTATDSCPAGQRPERISSMNTSDVYELVVSRADGQDDGEDWAENFQ
jgi:hypothetical protein